MHDVICCVNAVRAFLPFLQSINTHTTATKTSVNIVRDKQQGRLQTSDPPTLFSCTQTHTNIRVPVLTSTLSPYAAFMLTGEPCVSTLHCSPNIRRTLMGPEPLSSVRSDALKSLPCCAQSVWGMVRYMRVIQTRSAWLLRCTRQPIFVGTSCPPPPFGFRNAWITAMSRTWTNGCQEHVQQPGINTARLSESCGHVLFSSQWHMPADHTALLSASDSGHS